MLVVLGVSDVYMFNNAGDRTSPCGTPVLNCVVVFKFCF